MPGDTVFHRVRVAMRYVDQPVRVWLTQDDYRTLLRECRVRSARRFTFGGVPISPCVWPAVSRVVGASGVTRYV